MLTDVQQKRVWEGMLSAEIRANYFADLSNGYHRRQRIATWLTLFFSSGAFASFVFKELPPGLEWVRPLLALLTAALSAYSLVAQNQKLAVDSVDLHARWNKLAREYENLWDEMYASDALERLQKLEEGGVELSKSGASFGYDKKAMLKWQLHVERHRTAHAYA